MTEYSVSHNSLLPALLGIIIVYSFKFVFLRYIYSRILCTRLLCLYAPQKEESDAITDGHEPQCGCQELNSGLLEEHSALLTPERHLQPKSQFLIVQRLTIVIAHQLPSK